MNWNNISLIFQREVRDQLRDRRTLFMVAVLPLLLYPALGIGMVQMTLTFAEQTRRVIIIGADELPDPPLIENGRFVTDYFDVPSDAEKLEVVTDQPKSLDRFDDQTRLKLSGFMNAVSRQRESFERLAEIQQRESGAGAEGEERDLRQQLQRLMRRAPAEVLIVFPERFLDDYRAMNERLAARLFSAEDDEAGPRPVILYNSAEEKSEIPYKRVRQAVTEWKKTLLADRLRAVSLPQSLPDPVPMATVDLAEAEALAANIWSKIFPALLVIMAVTGAFYPAIDLGAGEKERGTMETLLISPAKRTEIVLGKFLTVMLFSISTALLNLASMGLTGRYMLTAVGSTRATPLGDLSLPPLTSLMWVVLLAIPLAALFSALSLSFAMFARSSKEGQYYLTPLLMVTMGLTVFCMNPGVELTAYYSVLPVIGPALLLKALLLGSALGTPIWAYAASVLVTSCAYSMFALWWAIEQFQREDILFREAERVDVRLWLRHLLREKEPTPTFAEAGTCFVLIALLQFVFLMSLQGSAAMAEGPAAMVTAQLIYLIATVGVPPLIMAVVLTSSVRRTLKLNLPSGQMLLAAVVLSLTLQPLALELLRVLDPFFPPPPAGAEQLMRMMGTDAVPLWLTLAGFALAPAVCEELAFRGFILSGLERSRHRWLPIVISSMLFGVIHMIPKMQFNAALLGLVLGLIAVRAGSLLPCIVFHAIFNGTQVLASRVKPENLGALDGTVPEWLVSVRTVSEQPVLRFEPPLLLICGVISALLIGWLIRKKGSVPGSGRV